MPRHHCPKCLTSGITLRKHLRSNTIRDTPKAHKHELIEERTRENILVGMKKPELAEISGETEREKVERYVAEA